MQFPKINWLYFQLGKVEDGHFLTCKAVITKESITGEREQKSVLRCQN